jgi:glutaredoxin
MTESAVTGDRTDAADADRIDFYWRPGCGFCSLLRRGLDKAGIERVEHDIWADPDAAAIVRSVARGNETVPTVVIGDIGMVNPTAKQVVAVLREHAPHLLPEGLDRPDDGDPPSGGTLGRLFARVRGG